MIMKYLGFLEDYLNEMIYGGEVNYLRTVGEYEYYSFTQWYSSGEISKYYIHTNGKIVLDKKGNKFVVEYDK